MNLDRFAAISFDTDWAPEEVMDHTLKEILPGEIPATFFVTNSYRCLGGHSDKHEIAPHTNPLALTEEALLGELDEKLAHCPTGCLGHRGHSLYWTERLRPIFRQKGIKYDSSTMMYLEGDIRPFKIGHDLVELPLFFMDFFHLECCALAGENPFSIDSLHLETNGLKILDFHPIHLFLNTPNIEFYASVKAHYQHPVELSKQKYNGYGIKNCFEDILNRLVQLGYHFATLKNIYQNL